ncbi:MAG: PAS domain S-box protein [Verrucomicrobia bacterium]|nr:PAS domain S-box protein [Verrucomicrobiota bacterium]
MDKEINKGKGELNFAAAAAAAAADVILEAMIDGVAIPDINGNIVHCNSAYAKMHGFKTPKEMKGINLSELIAERDVQRTMNEVKRCCEVGNTVNFEHTSKSKTGKEFPALVNASVLKDEKGNIVGVIGVVRDITELKRLQEEAAKTKEDTILEAIIDGVVVVDMNSNIIQCNSAFAKLFGFKSPEEMKEINLSGLIAERDVQRVMNEIKRCCEVGITVNFEHAAKDKAGQEFPIMVNGSVLKDEKGKIVGTIGVVRDITERKKAEEALQESEEKYRRLVETLQEGIWFIDKDANTSFVNQHMAEMLGYSVEEMLGKPLFDFMDEHGVEIAKRNMERRKQRIAEQHDFEFIRKDGSRIYTMVSTTPVTDEKGNYVGSLAGINDITERKLEHEKLLTAERLSVMGRLMADVTHELSNPLAVIIGETQLVLNHLDKKSLPLKEQLETVMQSAQRCKTILGNLHSYNRTIGKKEETINLPALIREAIKDVNYQYDMSGIETVLNCNEIANAEISGNNTALLSVFINLIRNARQAMGEKGRLTVTMQKEDKKHLRIAIHDTGSGMNDKQKAELFKPFTSGWKERGGSGLGLATSLGIMETHKGSMSAESEGVGKGATFTILLPCEFKDKK